MDALDKLITLPELCEKHMDAAKQANTAGEYYDFYSHMAADSLGCNPNEITPRIRSLYKQLTLAYMYTPISHKKPL